MMPTLPPSLCEDESIYHTGPSHPPVREADLHRFGCSICFIFSKDYPIQSRHLRKCEGPFIFVGSIKEEHYYKKLPFSIGAYAKIKEAFADDYDNLSNDVYWHNWHNVHKNKGPRSFGFSYNKIGEPSDENDNEDEDPDDNGDEDPDANDPDQSNQDGDSLSWPIDQTGHHHHSCHKRDYEFRIIYNCPGKQRSFIL